MAKMNASFNEFLSEDIRHGKNALSVSN